MIFKFIYCNFREMFFNVLYNFLDLYVVEIKYKFFYSIVYGKVIEQFYFVVFYLCEDVFYKEFLIFFVLEVVVIYYIFNFFKIIKGLFIK